ncbi:Disease resistance protein L6 [Linum perenne]
MACSSCPAVPAVLLLAVTGAALSLLILKKRYETSSSSSSSPPSTSVDTTTQPLPAVEYEVFLSFRGPDVRTHFADFLYGFLDHSKIRTFFDDVELRKGKELAPALVKAIEESKIFIPILSPEYASSKWCLLELARMVECWKQGNGHIILPIFYMMNPKDVRHQEGSYKKAFQLHSWKHDIETINKWKEALKKVGELKGWSIKKSDGQGAIIRQVFSCIRSHLMRNYLLVTEQLVSIGPHVQQVMKLLNKGVMVVGIAGMGGLGKTTIAMAVRDEVYMKFDYCFFLRDVRETLLGTSGIVALQKQLISTFPGHYENVEDASQGICIIKDRVCNHKTLIIIDDADKGFEFKEIFGNLEDFSSESRFIITTRNQNVLTSVQHELYIPDELSCDYSLQLFSRHAFGLDYPPDDYVTLSQEFVEVATGLPLSLKVIGSSLIRKNQKFWEAKLKQLKRIPVDQVQERLMISYLDLKHEERQIFLDIACNFIGERKTMPFYMWNDCDFDPEIVVDDLILKSLIKINDENEFSMHDCIRDLGRAIVREENHQYPWRRSRIWSNEDALEMLINGEGTDRLEILKVRIQDTTFKLTDRQFEKMSGLRHLEVYFGEFEGSFKKILPNIRWLKLRNCFSMPIDLNMKKLVHFHLLDCHVRDDWSGWEIIKEAHKLKVVHLEHCSGLEKAPDLSWCGDLELLNIEACVNMSGELHVGYLEKLKVLKLVDTMITELTGDIGMLQNLQEIHLKKSKLRELPEGIGRLPSLEILDMLDDQLKLKEFPALPTSLKRLYLSSPRISNLLDLENLEELSITNCKYRFPGDIWKLSKLKTLNLSRFRCKSLLEEDGIPSSLNKLEISNSNKLDRLPNLTNLSNLTRLVLIKTGVSEIVGLKGLRMLEIFEIREAPNLINLDGLEHLMLLKELSLDDCCALEQLPSLWDLTKLQQLEISCCQLLSKFCVLSEVGEPTSNLAFTGLLNLRKPFLDLSSLRNLQKLSISGIDQLSELKGLETLELLECLTITNCTSLGKLSSLSGLKNLKKLEINACFHLNDLTGLEKLEFLQCLSLNDCTLIKNLPGLSGLKRLQELDISNCTQLTEIEGLEGMESLIHLYMSQCTSIKELPNLSGLKLFSSLDISGCTQLAEVTGLEKLTSLKSLEMTDCLSIQKLPDLSCFKQLSSLNISGCTQLSEVTGIGNLKELRYLTIDKRLNIPPLQQHVQISRKQLR